MSCANLSVAQVVPTVCRYYGKSHTVLKATGLLLSQHGNECALIWNSFAPCRMEREGSAPDELRCGIAKLWGTGQEREEDHHA